MLRNGINCIKFYWFGIFCTSIISIVVSTFLDYRVLFSKGGFLHLDSIVYYICNFSYSIRYYNATGYSIE